MPLVPLVLSRQLGSVSIWFHILDFDIVFNGYME